MFWEQNKSAGEERLSFIPGTLHQCANIKIISNRLRTGSLMSYIAMNYHAQMHNTSFHLAPFLVICTLFFCLCPARPVLVSSQMVFPLLDYLTPFLANSGACQLWGTDALQSSLQRIRKCSCMNRQQQCQKLNFYNEESWLSFQFLASYTQYSHAVWECHLPEAGSTYRTFSPSVDGKISADVRRDRTSPQNFFWQFVSLEIIIQTKNP